MTVDRDRVDAAGSRLPTVVFRPWPPRATPPFLTRATIRPRFVRPPPMPAEAASERPNRAPPPRFARFAAALQSTAGAVGPEAARSGADRWQDAETGVATRPPAAVLAMPGGAAALAAIERTLRRLAIRRSALLIGAAGAGALALIALLEPTTGGQDRARLVGPPAEASGLVRTAPASGGPDPRLAAKAPIEVAAAVFETSEAQPDAALAPVGFAGLSAVARPAPPGIEASPAGLAAEGKFAAVAVRTGDLAEAQVEDEDPLYELGRRLQDKGELAQAIEAYRIAAEAKPGHAATWYDWGYLLQRQGDEAGAREKYLMTLRLAPRHAFAHYNLGYMLQKHGDYSGAIKHYQAAIAANPTFFWSYYNLGYLEQKLGDYHEALADYRKSIEIDPRQALAYENIATILRYHRNN